MNNCTKERCPLQGVVECSLEECPYKTKPKKEIEKRMSKYINADRLIQHLSDWRFGDNLEAFPCNELIEAIDNSPAADVAEVVYCKDCKHRDKNDVCTGLGIFAKGNVMVGDYFFCGAGERKETE